MLKSTVDPKERTMYGFTSSTLTFRRYSGGVKRQLLSCHKIFDLHNVNVTMLTLTTFQEPRKPPAARCMIRLNVRH